MLKNQPPIKPTIFKRSVPLRIDDAHLNLGYCEIETDNFFITTGVY